MANHKIFSNFLVCAEDSFQFQKVEGQNKRLSTSDLVVSVKVVGNWGQSDHDVITFINLRKL